MSNISASKILKEYRRSNKLSAIKLSRDLNVSPAMIYEWEKGRCVTEVRVRNWLLDPVFPTNVRELARRILDNHDQAVGTGS
jgi:transcriptional regulator with XRE-family HTH domain